MATAYFVTHPEVIIDPDTPVPDWGPSTLGSRRIASFCRRGLLDRVSDVFASDERKALDCAEALRSARGLSFRVDPGLRENDRSSTGYVSPPRFWAIVDDFFAHPTRSALGWETAADAQARVADAVVRSLAARSGDGDVIFLSHGGVGTLLLCRLSGGPIARSQGQPIPGGGCFFAFDADTFGMVHGWKDIADEDEPPR